MLPLLTSVTTGPQDKKRELSWTPVQICTSKCHFPLSLRGLSLMISVTVYLQHSQIFTCSKEMPCFDAETLVSASWVWQCFQLSWSGKHFGSFLSLHQEKTRLDLCLHLNQTELQCASEGPQWASLGECTFSKARTHLGCDPRSWHWISYVKFIPHRTTAVHFLYTSCNFHVHLMRILGRYLMETTKTASSVWGSGLHVPLVTKLLWKSKIIDILKDNHFHNGAKKTQLWIYKVRCSK